MLISIIIPCYNSDRFIATTLEMLISQGLNDCEVIVVNDGSKDKTEEIVREYKQIHLINKKNEGVSIARNIGIEKAKGKFIYFLDSDDTLAPGTLDFYRKVLTNYSNNSFFAFGYYSKYDGKLLKNYSAKQFNDVLLDSMMLKQSFFAKKLSLHICSCIYERNFLINNKITFTPGLRIGEDVEFLLKVIRFTPNCIYFARYCFIYQIRDDSTMQGYKAFSETHFHSYEIRKQMCFIDDFQTKEIRKFTNFWVIIQLISHLYMYLRSHFSDKTITENFINELELLNLPVPNNVTRKDLYIIRLVRFLPLKLFLRLLK